VQDVDRLQRPHHHLEVRDQPRVIPEDEIDAVDPDPVDLAEELQHRRPRAHTALMVSSAVRRVSRTTRARRRRRRVPLVAIAEVRRVQHLQRPAQVLLHDRLPDLRRVHHRRLEHRILRQDAGQLVRQVLERDVVPAGDGGWWGHDESLGNYFWRMATTESSIGLAERLFYRFLSKWGPAAPI
jgi:hypothetical protein